MKGINSGSGGSPVGSIPKSTEGLRAQVKNRKQPLWRSTGRAALGGCFSRNRGTTLSSRTGVSKDVAVYLPGAGFIFWRASAPLEKAILVINAGLAGTVIHPALPV